MQQSCPNLWRQTVSWSWWTAGVLQSAPMSNPWKVVNFVNWVKYADEYGTLLEWFWWLKIEVLGEKLVQVSLCVPQISCGLTQVWTWATVVRDGWWTAWPVTQPAEAWNVSRWFMGVQFLAVHRHIMYLSWGPDSQCCLFWVSDKIHECTLRREHCGF